jgi:hypothetical protein
MARKYLKWVETREVPPAKAPMSPPMSPMSSFDTPLYPLEGEEARKAREQSRMVMEKQAKDKR